MKALEMPKVRTARPSYSFVCLLYRRDPRRRYAYVDDHYSGKHPSARDYLDALIFDFLESAVVGDHTALRFPTLYPTDDAIEESV